MPPVKGQMQERGRARREQILDIAVDEFGRTGYNGPVLAAIARRLGVSQPAILHYFGSKEHLLLAVLEERRRRDANRARGLGEKGVLVALRHHAEFARMIESDADLIQLFSVLVAESLDPDAPLHDYFLRRYRSLRRDLATGIAEAQARGEIRADIDAEAKAGEIVAFMDGAQLQWLLDPHRVSLAALYESYATGLLRDLQCPPTGEGRSVASPERTASN